MLKFNHFSIYKKIDQLVCSQNFELKISLYIVCHKRQFKSNGKEDYTEKVNIYWVQYQFSLSLIY